MEDEELCRICLSSANEGDLISPCYCKGSQRFVHKKCLVKWQQSLMRGWSPQALQKARLCNVCRKPYNVEPPAARMFGVFEVLRSTLMLCFALFVSPFIGRTSMGFIIGLLALYIVVKSPYIACLILFAGSYLMVSFGARLVITATPAGGFQLAVIRHGAPVDGIRPGILLVSKAPHTGIFAHAVILLVDHEADGSYGIIINRPTTLTNAQNVTHTRSAVERQLYIGGPVPSPRVYLTRRPEYGARRVADLDLFLGSTKPPGVDGGDGALSGADDFNTVDGITIDGSSRWGPGQLDGEIRAATWSWIEKDVISVDDMLTNGSAGRSLWDMATESPQLRTF